MITLALIPLALLAELLGALASWRRVPLQQRKSCKRRGWRAARDACGRSVGVGLSASTEIMREPFRCPFAFCGVALPARPADAASMCSICGTPLKSLRASAIVRPKPKSPAVLTREA